MLYTFNNHISTAAFLVDCIQYLNYYGRVIIQYGYKNLILNQCGWILNSDLINKYVSYVQKKM